MDSRQRRTQKRQVARENAAWLRENADEVRALIEWINGGDMLVAAGVSDYNRDGVCTGRTIDMKPETRTAFGNEFPREKKFWREYLIERGVSPLLFADKKQSRFLLPA